MVLPNSGMVRTGFRLLLAGSFLFVAPAGLAQGWAPVPGAPAPSGGSYQTLPSASAAAMSGYSKLPLNPGMAAGRLEELRNLMNTTRPKEYQDAIGEYCDWLSDMADAHWKLAQAFGKDGGMRGYAESERQLCLKFGSLKRQAMLLKAEFLVAQHRYPEALGPLVDIVTAEPKTETGQHAYKILRDIGFSDATAATADDATATSKPAPASKPADKSKQ
jgi:hypothetical protein